MSMTTFILIVGLVLLTMSAISDAIALLNRDTQEVIIRCFVV